jgi:hypothetical protein
MASLLDGLPLGGAAGGLLDGLPPWLRDTVMGIQGSMPPNGIATAGYGQFPGQAPSAQPQLPVPTSQPSPYAAQASVQPMPQPKESPPIGLPPRLPFGQAPTVNGMGDRLYEALGGFLGNEGLVGGGAAAIKTLATGEVTNPYALTKHQQLQTYASLIRDFNLSPAQAQLAMQNPKVLEAFIPQIAPKYEFKEKGPYYGAFDPARGNFNIQGVAPEYQKLDQGQIGGHVFAPLPSGQSAPLPPGIAQRPGVAAPSLFGFAQNAGNPAKPQEVDAGTHTLLIDPQTRKVIGSVPKNIQEAKAQAVEGELRATANVNLPDTIKNANNALASIDQVINHPGKAKGTGIPGALWSIPGSRARDFDIAVNQLKSQSFLQAYTQLRGSGAISDKEGQVATAAMARLDQTGSEGEFNKALVELRDILKSGIDRARLKAGRTNALSGAPPAGYVVQ